jgi:hypothetical protein
MGRNDHLDDDLDLSNLPPEAFGNTFDVNGPFDPSDSWIANADQDDQIVAMRAWFLSRYCDPAQETPYAGREGGYLFIHGGPYHPDEELHRRFSGLVDDELIDELSTDLVVEVGEEWAPIEHEDRDSYDDRFDFDLDSAAAPGRQLTERIQQASIVLTLEGDEGARALATRLVLGAAISALEAYLWETTSYWVKTEPQVLQNIVTKLPSFRERTIKLGAIFSEMDGLETLVQGYLQNLVWHRWDKVAPLLKFGLGIEELPSFDKIEAFIDKRHDIVHRSGHDKDGNVVSVNLQDVEQLMAEILTFASKINLQLSRDPWHR